MSDILIFIAGVVVGMLIVGSTITFRVLMSWPEDETPHKGYWPEDDY